MTSSQKLKILIIDDSPEDFYAIQRALDLSGSYQTLVHASTAVEGLELLRDQTDFSCILVDHGLPGMSGLELIPALREQAPRSALIMLTGQGNEETAVEAMKAGVHDYLAKANFAHLNRAIQSAVDRNLLELKVAEQQRQLEYQAFHDSLTGLPNREFLLQSLKRILAAHRRKRAIYAILFIDLDRFKPINDAYGHAVGDAVLVEVANRIRGELRANDLAARLGGDEFVVYADGIRNRKDATRIAERILSKIEATIHTEGHDVQISATIGIAIDDGGHYASPNDVVRDADVAMYRAKRDGLRRPALFDASLQEAVRADLDLERDLRTALERDEFFLEYQPIVASASGRVKWAEALVRWNHPTQGLISPARFIPLAEETGLIADLGLWVLQRAVFQAAEWANTARVGVAVNVSAIQIQDPEFSEVVRATIDEAGLDGHLLQLELTEGILIKATDEVLQNLERLRQMGVKIALDDFGTGYSALGLLKSVPMDVLKIDRIFVKDLMSDFKSQVIAEVILSLAGSLDLKPVAEGVEDEDQLAFLQRAGCESIQGFFFSKPLGAEALLEYARQADDRATAEVGGSFRPSRPAPTRRLRPTTFMAGSPPA